MVLGTDALREGEKTIYTQQVIIHFGDAGGKNGELEERIAEFFTRSGVSFVLESNMKRKFWYKYMINVGINQTTAVLRLPYKAFQFNGGKDAIPEAKLLMEKTMREVIAVANAEGVDLNEGDMEKIYEPLLKLNTDSSTSMCQDVMAGRKTEVELFSLTIMELAKKHGISVPVNEVFYLQLKIIEQRYEAEAS